MTKLTGKVPLDFAELYPRLYPVLGILRRGALSDWWIYKHYKAFNVVAKMYYPENPRSGEQQGWRSVFYDAVKNWQGFDEETRRYYNALKGSGVMSGYNRYLRLYLRANFPMIIYWETLEKNAGDVKRVPDYIASTYFTAGLYPAAANKLLALGSSGDLVLPADFSAKVKAKAKAWLSTPQSNILSGVFTKILLDTESYDPGSNFDVANSKFVAPITGYYAVLAQMRWNSLVALKRYSLIIYVDGVLSKVNASHASVVDALTCNLLDILYLTAGQYLELYCYHGAGVDTLGIDGGFDRNTYLAVHLLST